MTARAEILAAIPAAAASDRTVSVDDLIREMRRRGSNYADSTIRTHVGSRMCANAPANQATTLDDVERAAPGVYRLRIVGRRV